MILTSAEKFPMAIQLDHVVPFGRSFAEYQKMFRLTPLDLRHKILGIADGPASFNAEATQRGCQITSVDPLYQFEGSEIEARFQAVVDDIMAQIEATPNDWVWSHHQSPADLRHNRERALQLFLADYEQGKQAGRYRVGELPQLPDPDHTFDLALCSHFLFLYSGHYDLDFHWAAIQELLRVSKEVRIFPLLTLQRSYSPHLKVVLTLCRQQKIQAQIIPVPYELQKGGNQMLVLQG